MVVTMPCFVNRSASMPRLDVEPPDPDGPGGGLGTGGRNRQFTVYCNERNSSNTLSSGYNTLSRGYRGVEGNGACLYGCLPYLSSCTSSFRSVHSSAIDVRRQPISALAARGFWNGISELRNVLTPGNPLLEKTNATFYVRNPSKSSSRKARKMMDEEDQFFKDINSLYQRQKVLFQKCCEQLKDIYLVEGRDISSNNTELNNDFFLLPVSHENSESSESEAAKNGTESAKAKKSKSKVTMSPFGETSRADVYDFYVDIIYVVLHMIGCDVPKNAEATRWQLVEHLRKAFRLSPSEHMELYDRASIREEPDLKLNLCVLEAKDLKAKDNLARPSIDGAPMSRGDPFVTFYLLSKPFEVTNTGFKSRTLDPVWNESFAISLPNTTDYQDTDEVLHIDVWNFIQDEKLTEKLKKINEVKDPKGLRQYIMDVAAGSSNNVNSGGGNQHKLIGSVEIPIKDIPASGLNKWWTLEKLDNKSNKKNRGEIHLLMHLSTSNKSPASTLEDHRRLLRVLLSYELLKRRSQPFQWKDEFVQESLQILTQHAVQGRMSRIETAMSRWLVYVEMHLILPFDYRVFTPILEKLRKHVQTRMLPAPSTRQQQLDTQTEKDLKKFDAMAEKFSAQCILFIRRHRYYLGNNYEKYYIQLEAILKSLHILHCLKWKSKDDIVVKVENALVKSDSEWFRFVADKIVNIEDTSGSSTASDDDSNNADPAAKSNALKMRNLTRVTHLLIADLESGSKHYRELFRQTLNIDYKELAFKEYENQLRQSAKNMIRSICDSLIVNPRLPKDLKNSCCCPAIDEGIESSASSSSSSYACDHECVEIIVPEFDFLIGSRLFELYLALQKFYAMGKDFPVSASGPRMTSTPASSVSEDMSFTTSSSVSSSQAFDDVPYYMWFLKAVAKWLDIALFKAVRRILKAVELDTLKSPVDQLVKHTNSAVDIRTVFGQISTFWHQLSWPDAETSYVFVSRMLADVCQSATFYAEKMSAKATENQRTDDEQENVQNMSEVHFTLEQCHAINNIEFVLQSIRPFVEELRIELILRRIEDANGGLVADACRKTIKNVVENAIENVEIQILQVLQKLGETMAPTISKFLADFTKMPNYQQISPSLLLQYLDANLIFLKSNLVPANFERVLAVIWSTSATSFNTIIHDAIASKKPIGYFVHLYESYRILVNFFYGDDIPTGDTSLALIDRQLKLFASDGIDLLHNYYEQRFSDQEYYSSRGNYPIGSLTVRAIVNGAHLRIEILNGRHLLPLEAQQNRTLSPPPPAPPSQSTGTLRRRDTLRHSFSHNSSLSSRARSVGGNLSSSHSTLTRNVSGSSGNITGSIKRGQLVEPPENLESTSTGRTVGKDIGDKIESFRARIDEIRLQFLHEALMIKRGGLRNRRMGRDESWNNSHRVIVAMSNPYVSVRLVPDHDGVRFRERGLKKMKTKTQTRTLFPLFDEKFELLLPEGTDRTSTFLLFTVKDKGVMGEGIFMGEAILPLRKIIKDDQIVALEEIPQQQLALTRPGKEHKDILFAIQTRLNESSTKEFLRKERRKLMI